MAKPFVLNNNLGKKNETKVFVPREVKGRLWAEIKSNTGGDWGYKDPTCMVKINYATGVVTQSHKWLLGVVSNGEDLFEIHDKKANGKNEKGYVNYEATPNEEEVKTNWEEQGCLTAILCDGIPQLELLAEFAQNKFIYNDTGYEVKFKENPPKDIFFEIAKEIVEKQDAGYSSSRMNKKHKEYLKNNSWFYLVFTEEEILVTEDPNIGDAFTYEVDDNGLICSVSVDWEEPNVKASYSGSNGGNKGQSEAEVIDDRISKFLQLFSGSDIDATCEMLELNPVQVKMSLILGAVWVGDSNSYVGTLRSKTEGNGKNGKSTKTKSKTASQETIGKEAPDVEPEEDPDEDEESDDDISDLKESTEATNNGHTKDQSGLYLGLILGLEGERKFPKEVDAEFLKAKGTLWCERFYKILCGKIKGNVPYGTDGVKARIVNGFVNKEFKKPLFQLSIEELGSLMGKSEFEEGEINLDNVAAI